MGAREQRFASRGHVYFSESVHDPLSYAVMSLALLGPCVSTGLNLEQCLMLLPQQLTPLVRPLCRGVCAYVG